MVLRVVLRATELAERVGLVPGLLVPRVGQELLLLRELEVDLLRCARIDQDDLAVRAERRASFLVIHDVLLEVVVALPPLVLLLHQIVGDSDVALVVDFSLVLLDPSPPLLFQLFSKCRFQVVSLLVVDFEVVDEGFVLGQFLDARRLRERVVLAEYSLLNAVLFKSDPKLVLVVLNYPLSPIQGVLLESPPELLVLETHFEKVLRNERLVKFIWVYFFSLNFPIIFLGL